MNIVVPIKLVPDLVEELEIDDSGTDIDRDFLTYKINEFDDHALEEALQLKEAHGGTVTVVALEREETDKALYTALAKGADRAIKITGVDEAASTRTRCACARSTRAASRPPSRSRGASSSACRRRARRRATRRSAACARS